MTQHITQEQAVELATRRIRAESGPEYVHELCNAAIQHYIDAQPSAAVPEAPEDTVSNRRAIVGAPGSAIALMQGMQRRIKELEAKAPPAPAKPLTDADMFWNHDDAEQLYGSIDEFLNDEICNGSLEVGDVRTVQQAKHLPNVQIKITSIDSESCDAEYEVIEAHHNIKEQP